MAVSTRFGARAATVAALVTVMLVTCGATAWGQVSLWTYTQDFNTLASSGTSVQVPNGWAFSETGGSAPSTYSAGTGSSTTGETYSFGIAGVNPVTERAFGGLASNTVTAIRVGASFTNYTDSTITSLAISYTGEQWRVGGSGTVDSLSFSYSLDAVSLTSGTWTVVSPLTFSSPNTSTTSAHGTGNTTGYRTTITHTISGLSIASGATFWIRWLDANMAGSDDGLAVDDFSLTAMGTPTYTLTYTAGPGGTISGTSPQTVAHGGNGTEVTAVPNPGLPLHELERRRADRRADRDQCHGGRGRDRLVRRVARAQRRRGHVLRHDQRGDRRRGTLNGHTLQVAAGTFEEQVLVNKGLTITGAGCGSTIIRSPVDAGPVVRAPQGTTKPIVFVNGVDATIQNLTIDGAGRG